MTRILTINEFRNFLIIEGKKSDEEKLAILKKKIADWDEEHESALAKKRNGSSLKKKERLRKRIASLQKKIKKETAAMNEGWDKNLRNEIKKINSLKEEFSAEDENFDDDDDDDEEEENESEEQDEITPPAEADPNEFYHARGCNGRDRYGDNGWAIIKAESPQKAVEYAFQWIQENNDPFDYNGILDCVNTFTAECKENDADLQEELNDLRERAGEDFPTNYGDWFVIEWGS